jgi:hypothetical protein
MSLPASQQRVLDRMETRLRAGEPHLASMFGIFARLNAVPASQYAIRTNGDLALPPSAGASPGPGDTSGMC